MLGTIVNTSAIIMGSSVGAIFKKGIKEKQKAILYQAMGLVAISLGITWIVTNLSKNNQPLLFIVSMVIGGLIGEAIDIEEKVNRLGKRISGNNDKKLIEGLTTAVLLFCVGTLSILGPIESALKGDNTLLFTNAMLDGITSMILATTFGIGIMLSGVILFIWQGTIFLLAQFIGPYATPVILNQISIIGGILIFSTGINILEIKKIKTINLIPALFIPVIYNIPFINKFIVEVLSYFAH
ncbi:DUF554 domain-containing protein [Vallitalea sp.]|jgi:uncharacterized membrane protein YqgA involved in biofilm formation|uniref:DUF554 domain-containing protein n=1 Tax=Vallitalea sp. TaxID=1882829 RepID=UPI0025ED3BFC|nr:DUF554 domain-containing protein [Vallitalea sp.]MCT4686117.1 DUF554 domain-containing protein [Vallitalea sp.]